MHWFDKVRDTWSYVLAREHHPLLLYKVSVPAFHFLRSMRSKSENSAFELLQNLFLIIILQWIFMNLFIYILILLSLSCCSVTQSCLTLCPPMDCSTPGFPVLHHLLELAQTHVHRVGDAIQTSRPLLSPSPCCFQSFPASESFLENQSTLCVRWSKYWSFSISPSKEYSGLISFRIDWFDLLAVQGTLKSLLWVIYKHSIIMLYTWWSVSVKWSESVSQSCPTLCNYFKASLVAQKAKNLPMGCSPLVSTGYGIFHTRILEWVDVSFSRGSSQPRDWTQVYSTAGRFFTDWATKEACWMSVILN